MQTGKQRFAAVANFVAPAAGSAPRYRQRLSSVTSSENTGFSATTAAVSVGKGALAEVGVEFGQEAWFQSPQAAFATGFFLSHSNPCTVAAGGDKCGLFGRCDAWTGRCKCFIDYFGDVCQ